MRKHYERILHDSESRVQRYLDIQILDEHSPFCGGFPKADSLAEPKTAIYRATTMTACYLNPESRYYLDAELGRRQALALAFVRRSQRPGGYLTSSTATSSPARIRLSAPSGCCPPMSTCARSWTAHCPPRPKPRPLPQS